MNKSLERLRTLLSEQGYDIDDPETLKAIHQKVKATGIKVEDIASLTVSIKDYQMGSKDNEGNPQVTDLRSISVKATTYSQRGIVVPKSTAAPVTVQPIKAPPRRAKKLRVAAILPDPQIGFRRVDDELLPFHDEDAMSVALQVTRYLQEEYGVDKVVNLGDFVDLPAHSKYMQETTWQNTTNASINRAHQFLAQQRAVASKADIVLLEGNHDMRLMKSALAKAPESVNLKSANGKWPVLSVPNLLELDSLGVEYVAGYPSARYWINDRLACMHGYKVNSSGSTAARVIRDERASVIFGHVHRFEQQMVTVDVRGGNRTYLAASPGCLCRIDGAVPGYSSGIDVFGRPIASTPNWQQGMAVVYYEEGDKPFRVEMIYIDKGETFYHGNWFRA